MDKEKLSSEINIPGTEGTEGIEGTEGTEGIERSETLGSIDALTEDQSTLLEEFLDDISSTKVNQSDKLSKRKENNSVYKSAKSAKSAKSEENVDNSGIEEDENETKERLLPKKMKKKSSRKSRSTLPSIAEDEVSNDKGKVEESVYADNRNRKIDGDLSSNGKANDSSNGKANDSNKHDSSSGESSNDGDNKGDCKDDNRWYNYIAILVLAIFITVLFLILCYPMVDVWMTSYVPNSTYRWLYKGLLFFIFIVIIFVLLAAFWC